MPPALNASSLAAPAEAEAGPSASVAELGLAPVRHERFAERVYDSLFHAVMTGKLAPGARLPSELELAGFFQVSRPVVRQALDRLRKDGLVNSVRGSGSYVRDASAAPAPAATPPAAADMAHILHGLELRLIVEPECAYLAALRRKPQDLARMEEMLEGFEQAAASGDVAHHFDYGFHEAIAQATANPRMAQVLATLKFDVSHAINLWRHMAQMRPWQRSQDVLDEHRRIYELIRAQDAEGARRAMRSHVEKARIRMLEATPGI